MDRNSRVVYELVGVAKELKASQGELKASHEEHMASQRLVNKSLAAMLQGHAEEMRDIKKMTKEHEKWMRDHEVRLKLHFRLIQRGGG